MGTYSLTTIRSSRDRMGHIPTRIDRICLARVAPSIHCKKRLAVFPSLARMSFSLIPARESLVSDILAGDGKTTNLFLQCKFRWKICTVASFYQQWIKYNIVPRKYIQLTVPLHIYFNTYQTYSTYCTRMPHIWFIAIGLKQDIFNIWDLSEYCMKYPYFHRTGALVS
jgi:hypothetical protein